MQKNSKIKKILIITLAILLFLALFFYFSQERRPVEDPVITEQEGDLIKTEEERIIQQMEQQRDDFVYTFDAQSEMERTWTRDDFIKISKSFAETFGSFSNHANFGNLINLTTFDTTKRKADWLDSYITGLKNDSAYSGIYYNIRSEAFIAEIDNFLPESNKVEVLVSLERFETRGDEEERSFRQELLVVFLKEGGKWLIDDASWQ